MKKLLAALLITFSSVTLAGPLVEFKTSAGDFTVELNPEKAPKTVEKPKDSQFECFGCSA